ncbi:HAMP domain-containing sensor histidine kinase [Peptostreptococcus faecalis]|uniref:HAMP domain-containing sensor histidine kinase n=1 Tax=Peptostreptococcus faecalis TaxID=2045015 RepID=UPI000C7C2331|nr:HAMP domain-containing sensor histidine kinase [Peptostreptococcus faecalis]
MEIKKNVKSKSIFYVFLSYIIRYSIAIVISIILILFTFNLSILNGYILPANYTENIILSKKEEIINNREFNKDLIPNTAKYVLYDKNYSVISSNLPNNLLNEFVHSKEKKLKRERSILKVYERKNGEKIEIIYNIKPEFASINLQKKLPSPEVLLILCIVINIISISAIMSLLFNRKIKKEINIVLEATNAVSEKRLDFKENYTKINEFNRILDSINNLRVALNDSLISQWNEQNNKKIQLSSIAHDVKTPLTLIKCNAELLTEEYTRGKNKKLLNNIIAGEKKIEEYMEILMDSLLMDRTIGVNNKNVFLNELLNDIKNHSTILCKSNDIMFKLECDISDMKIYIDEQLVKRALMNIISNACKHTKEGGIISLKVETEDYLLKFTVLDEGEGFTDEGLKNASKFLYTNDKERSGKNYGIGLFVAELVASNHGGKLILSNRKDTRGASVSFFINSIRE